MTLNFVMLSECAAPHCGVAQESKHPYSYSGASEVGTLRLRRDFASRSSRSAQDDREKGDK